MAEEHAQTSNNEGKNTPNNEKNLAKGGHIPAPEQEKGAKKATEEAQAAQKKPQTAEDKVRELTQMLQRLQAEFENYQKRNARENAEYRVYANAKLLEELLPVLDSLEAGMPHNKEFALIHEQLYSILKKKGIEKIRAERGMKFNHDTMECMLKEQCEGVGEDAVANVLIEGYALNGKILRPAKVSVSAEGAGKKTTDKKEPQNEQGHGKKESK